MSKLPLEEGLYTVNATRYYPWVSAGSGGYVANEVETYKMQKGLVGHFSEKLFELRGPNKKSTFQAYAGRTSEGGIGVNGLGEFPHKKMIPLLMVRNFDGSSNYNLPDEQFFITYFMTSELEKVPRAVVCSEYHSQFADVTRILRAPVSRKLSMTGIFQPRSTVRFPANLEEVSVFQPFYTKSAADDFIKSAVDLHKQLFDHEVRQAQAWASLRNQFVGQERE